MPPVIPPLKRRSAITQAQIIGPRDLRLVTAPARSPGKGEILVKPDAVGICGTDLELFAGDMAYLKSGFAAYPIVPGHEWTGIVATVGTDVEGFAVGDRVVGECSIGCGSCPACRRGAYHLCADRVETGIARRDGGLSSEMLFPARAAHVVPASVAPLDAALIEPLAVAYRALEKLGTSVEGPIAIIGAGTIGLLVALLARALEIGEVVIFETREPRAAFAASLGFPSGSDSDRFPSVIEASGAAKGVELAVRVCADGGNVILLGLTGAPSVPVALDSVVVRDIALRGSLGSPGVWKAAIGLVADRRVAPSALVSHTFPLSRVSAAFDLARSAAGHVRKVVVLPQPDVVV